MTATKKLAIFDIDGTLTDSTLVHQDAFIRALGKLNLVDFDTNWNNYTHHTDSHIFKTIYELQFKTAITQEIILQFEEKLHEEFTSHITREPIREIKGAKKFVEVLRGNPAFDIVFATGSLHRPARLKLDQIGIHCHDDLLIAANEIYSREELVKKAIELAKQHYAAEKYDHIISFGDGYWDYTTAQNVNIDFIGIRNKDLVTHGVLRFFEDFEAEELQTF